MDARAAINGIQEVSGSIPLISTTSPENHWFSGLFLVVIANNRCIIRIFRTGALHPGLRYSPYRNRTGITTVPGGPIRPNPGLFPRKRHWKTSRLPPISPAPERADSALSCPHRHVPRCSGWLPGQRPTSASGKHRCVGSCGGQNPNPLHPLHCLLKLRPEGGWIAGHPRLSGRFPDEGILRVPEQLCIAAEVFGHRDTAVAVKGFGCPQRRRALVHAHSLLDGDGGAVLRNVPGFQPQQLLRPHSRAQHQPDAPANFVLRQLVQKKLDFPGGERLLRLGARFSHLVRVGSGILVQQIVGNRLVEDLKQHPPALGDSGIGGLALTKLFQKLLNVIGFDLIELASSEMAFQNPQGVAVALLCGRLDVILMVFKPQLRPLAEGVLMGKNHAFFLRPEIGSHLFLDFRLGIAVKAFVLAFAVGLKPIHDGALPKAVFALANMTFAVGSFLCH